MKQIPLIFKTDSYKTGHFEQMNRDADRIYIYGESRYGFDNLVWYGLQGIIKLHLMETITVESVEQMRRFTEAHGTSFNYDGWMDIAVNFEGKLPFTIRALPEGMVVPSRTPVFVLYNEGGKRTSWLIPYFEALLHRVWYPTVVATKDLEKYAMLRKWAEKSVDDVDAYLTFALHDFGARGASSSETAAIGGSAHLMGMFRGTDTLEGAWFAKEAYGLNDDVAGYSVNAIEHNVVLSHGVENEYNLFKDLIDLYLPAGKIISIVSDTRDIDAAVDWYIDNQDYIADQAAKGGEGSRVVVRPDSGDPIEVPVRVVKKLIKGMSKYVTKNNKGYLVLPSWIRVIQGDGVELEQMDAIHTLLTDAGISAENIIFGQGGSMLQAHGRDDAGFAMKMSAMEVDGRMVKTSKKPKTDARKHSREGYFKVARDENGDIVTLATDDPENSGLLEVVYSNGELIRDMTFDQVRANYEIFVNKKWNC
ncbi:MAG: nicotinate phosphoribosyltransferase [Sphingobium sp.]|nr:nicotinate phosphoribosyltransferase [Sphingobium sp.]|tara:strand:+ start:12844 stop:14274 length:1431 start_codon:yes stop_codon:yes gene_type:complete